MRDAEGKVSRFCPGFILHIPAPRTISLPGFATIFRVILKSGHMWIHLFAQRTNQISGIDKPGRWCDLFERSATSSWCFDALLPYRSGSQNAFAQELVRKSNSWIPLRLIKLAILGMGPSNQYYNKPSRWLSCLTKVWEPLVHACALEALTYIQNA